MTTAEPGLRQYAGRGAFAAFLPNPVDPSVETGRAFETPAPAFDLLFPAHDDRPREIGDESLSPSAAVARLRDQCSGPAAVMPRRRRSARGLRIRLFPRPYVGADPGWSLSRRSSLPLYASDRMAHMFGWGLAVLLDRRAGFDRFYGDDEAAFYDGFDELIAKVRRLMADDEAAREMARRGWEKTWALFDSGRVLAYVLAQLQGGGGASGYEWPCERWSA